MSIDITKKYINGPVNVVRLQGKIGTVDKIIYLFMDYHIDVYKQSSCEDLLSVNVEKYFAQAFKSMDNGKKKYDFILEIDPDLITDINDDNNKTREKYIRQNMHLFKSIYRQQQQKSNRDFRNIRLHYLDIREYVDDGTELLDILDDLRELYAQNYNKYAYDEIVGKLYGVADRLQMITDANNSKKSTKAIKLIGQYVSSENKFGAIQHVMNKIKNIYHHQSVKAELVQQYHDVMEQIATLHQNILSLCEKLREIQPRLESTRLTDYGDQHLIYYMPYSSFLQLVSPLAILLEKYAYQFIHIFANFTDLYILRRILDKDYITNSIIYSGAYHSKNYIEILVREFGFEITHASFARKSIKQINSEIKTTTTPEKTINWLFSKNYINQCSDMTSFPDDFN